MSEESMQSQVNCSHAQRFHQPLFSPRQAEGRVGSDEGGWARQGKWWGEVTDRRHFKRKQDGSLLSAALAALCLISLAANL